jgi:hypothetical protein
MQLLNILLVDLHTTNNRLDVRNAMKCCIFIYHTPENTSLMYTYMINKVNTYGIICERKGKHVNWCIFVEWTI